MSTPVFLTYYYPHLMALIFLVFFFATDVPAKGRFFLRAVTALSIATFLAHANRIFHLYPSLLYFPSGHMTFCLGVALSLGMLRPWTLAISLPLLVPFGAALVALHFHGVWDVLGAIPLVLGVYGIVHWDWNAPMASRPLDRRASYP
ncbi:MAG TPA: hypothetical protein VGZ93_03165 [Candidatus Methylacidiphilales bacterium]|jgi:hypothetical protein|nr:hypothetical protein [Candidatus Methylacidiphilales bacterium]